MPISSYHLSPAWSALLVYGAQVALPALLLLGALLSWLRYHRRAAESAEHHDPAAPLREGAELTLHGEVELAATSDVAMRVEVEQDGWQQASSGSWSYSWTETKRTVTVAPFYLRLDGGARVRVEPSGEALLVDAMDGVILVDQTKRIRVAQLQPGERVYARGLLTRATDPEAGAAAYRQAPVGLTLRPPRRGRMLLSSAPLGAPFASRARKHRSGVLALGALLLVLHGLPLAGYHLRVLGHTETGRVSKLEDVRGKGSDGDERHTYEVSIAAPSGLVRDEVSEQTFKTLRRGATSPVRIAAGRPSASSIGAAPTVHGLLALLCLCPVLVVIGWYLRSILRKAWYEGRLVDRGDGELADHLIPPGSTQLARNDDLQPRRSEDAAADEESESR